MSVRAPLAGRDDRCTKRSLAADEPLAGTASTLRRWLLIEHAGPWGRDGLRDARLPEGIGDGLRRVERATRCRVLLIRRPARSGSGGRCFAVDTADAWIGATSLDHVARALDLDPRDRSSFTEPVDGPVAVVCTHGRRDACCAERGRPVAAALAATVPDAAWESTHVGGDRFAANLVAFPHGLMFGRVEPERAAEVVGDYARGRITLDRFRGRTCDPMPAQAADQAARTLLGLDGVDDVRPRELVRDGHDDVRVRLTTTSGDALVHLRRTWLPPMRLTCGSNADEAPAVWSVRGIDVPG